MMKKYSFLLVAALVLSGCSAGVPVPPFYEDQGFNISECGPAVCAMMVKDAGGMSDRFKARATDSGDLFWSYREIGRCVDEHGLDFDVKKMADQSVDEFTGSGGFYINHSHFVFVKGSGVDVEVFDPLPWRGRSMVKWADFRRRVSSSFFLSVPVPQKDDAEDSEWVSGVTRFPLGVDDDYRMTPVEMDDTDD